LTEANIRSNVREEIVRAEECLKEAEVLEREGFYAGGVSRVYYAVFHCVRALLTDVMQSLKALPPRP